MVKFLFIVVVTRYVEKFKCFEKGYKIIFTTFWNRMYFHSLLCDKKLWQIWTSVFKSTQSPQDKTGRNLLNDLSENPIAIYIKCGFYSEINLSNQALPFQLFLESLAEQR